MISITHADPAATAEEEFLIPAGGRRMDMDWECVARAFQAANEEVGWDADITLTPERQHALVRFPRGRAEHVGETTVEFYRAIEARIGVERFMSIWIDFLSRP